MTFERRHDDQHQHRRRRQCFDESDKNLTATLGPDYGPGSSSSSQRAPSIPAPSMPGAGSLNQSTLEQVVTDAIDIRRSRGRWLRWAGGGRAAAVEGRSAEGATKASTSLHGSARRDAGRQAGCRQSRTTAIGGQYTVDKDTIGGGDRNFTADRKISFGENKSLRFRFNGIFLQ